MSYAHLAPGDSWVSVTTGYTSTVTMRVTVDLVTGKVISTSTVPAADPVQVEYERHLREDDEIPL